ncbi:MAG: threonine--tRNA ligase [Clostridiales bacterium]|nr:threonine--tRNA ligase [Clostridiales bacterium]
MKLKDGSVREYAQGTAVIDIVRELSEGLARKAVAAELDGRIVGLTTPLTDDGALNILTFDDEKGRDVYRHTAAHIMAQAVKRLYPDVKLAIGPAIENGFYYDFDTERPFSVEDFEAIETEMKKIIGEKLPIERFELPREDALALVEQMNEPYKAELIRDLPEDAVISFYRQGEYTDMCAGPHLPDTGRVKATKLLSVAGAYWRGSEKNKMLQRIYGTAFDDRKELKAYLDRIEEAKMRDHRKLGRELDLFSILDEGPGFPFFHPKGMIVRNLLEDYWRRIHTEAGYQEIKTPIMLNRELWMRSGHWEHYRENMYTSVIDETPFAIKPMNCPGGMLLYKRRKWSYRDLPMRVGELGLVHRHELSGALHGLMRVRCFTQDDAHIFMREDQMIDEINGVIDLTTSVYDVFGFKYNLELSTRPENSMGSDEAWEMATGTLREALNRKGLPYKINEGDGAFYGPKIDFHLEDSIGRTWQCGTIQLDFQMPELFDLTYTNERNEEVRPVMVHRVIYGSIERFIGILTEHFAGAFPLWLSPEQVRVLSITDRVDDYVKELIGKLRAAGLRASADLRNEKIGFKIREAVTERIPYMLVVGDNEMGEGTVAVRRRGQGDIGSMRCDEFIAMACRENDGKAI